MTTLPIEFASAVSFKVSPNDQVKIGQIIAESSPQTDYVIDLINEFSSSADKVRKYLRKNPGDHINKGDLLAVKKNFLGLSEERIISKVSGNFARYERDTGKIIISIDTEKNIEDIVSPVDGVVQMCDNNKIVIAVDKDVYMGSKSTGGNASGEIYILDGAFPKEEKPTRETDISLYYDLDSRAIGKIIIGGDFPRELLIKSIGMGVAGIIGTNIRNDDIEYLSRRHLQVPIIEVDLDQIKEITKWKKNKLYLNTTEKSIIVLHA